MRKRILNSIMITAFVLSAAGASQAAVWKKVVVAVPEAEVFFKSGVDATYASMITDRLVSAFEASGKIETKNDSDIEQIMKTMTDAQALGGGDACKTDDKCMLRIAQKMQVGYVAKLKVIEIDGNFTVTLRMIRVNADKDVEQITRDLSSKRSITDAVTTLGTEVGLKFTALEAKIRAVVKDVVYLDHGASSGLKNDITMIVKRKVEVKDDDGTIIHSTFEELGRVILTDVQTASSQGKITKGKNFEKGDSVFIDEAQILKDMKAKEDARKIDEEKRRQKEVEDQKDSASKAASRSSDSRKESIIADRKMQTYLTLRLGGGSAEMGDKVLNDVYGVGTLGMFEAILGSNTFGLYGRFQTRSFEMTGDLYEDRYRDNGIISLGKAEITTFDIGTRIYLGPEFYWVIAKVYASIAWRMNFYNETATVFDNDIEYNFSASGWTYGIGAEITLFNTIGVFAEYNNGTCEIGESGKNIEGSQVIVGATLKI